MDPVVTLQPLTAETAPVLERLWQLYQHDLSEFRGRHGPDGFRGTLPGEDGSFARRRLLPFLAGDADRATYVVYSNASPAGFAFVSGLTAAKRLMAEFFVVRGARGQGIGRAAAEELLRRHPGDWEIPFQDANVAAARFWRRLAGALAGGAVREERRPVPGKPEVPPDVWLTISAR